MSSPLTLDDIIDDEVMPQFVPRPPSSASMNEAIKSCLDASTGTQECLVKANLAHVTQLNIDAIRQKEEETARIPLAEQDLRSRKAAARHTSSDLDNLNLLIHTSSTATKATQLEARRARRPSKVPQPSYFFRAGTHVEQYNKYDHLTELEARNAKQQSMNEYMTQREHEAFPMEKLSQPLEVNITRTSGPTHTKRMEQVKIKKEQSDAEDLAWAANVEQEVELKLEAARAKMKQLQDNRRPVARRAAKLTTICCAASAAIILRTALAKDRARRRLMELVRPFVNKWVRQIRDKFRKRQQQKKKATLSWTSPRQEDAVAASFTTNEPPEQEEGSLSASASPSKVAASSSPPQTPSNGPSLASAVTFGTVSAFAEEPPPQWSSSDDESDMADDHMGPSLQQLLMRRATIDMSPEEKAAVVLTSPIPSYWTNSSCRAQRFDVVGQYPQYVTSSTTTVGSPNKSSGRQWLEKEVGRFRDYFAEDTITNCLSATQDPRRLAQMRAERIELSAPLTYNELLKNDVFAFALHAQPQQSQQGNEASMSASVSARGWDGGASCRKVSAINDNPLLAELPSFFTPLVLYEGEPLVLPDDAVTGDVPANPLTLNMSVFIRQGSLHLVVDSPSAASYMSSSGELLPGFWTALIGNAFQFPIECLHRVDPKNVRRLHPDGTLFHLCTFNQGEWINARLLAYAREHPQGCFVAATGCDLFIGCVEDIRCCVEASFDWHFTVKMLLNCATYPARRLPASVLLLLPDGIDKKVAASQSQKDVMKAYSTALATSVFTCSSTALEEPVKSPRQLMIGRLRGASTTQYDLSAHFNSVISEDCHIVEGLLSLFGSRATAKFLRAVVPLFRLVVFDASECITQSGKEATHIYLILGGSADWVDGIGKGRAFKSHELSEGAPPWINDDMRVFSEAFTSTSTIRCRSTVVALSLQTRSIRYHLWLIEKQYLTTAISKYFPESAKKHRRAERDEYYSNLLRMNQKKAQKTAGEEDKQEKAANSPRSIKPQLVRQVSRLQVKRQDKMTKMLKSDELRELVARMPQEARDQAKRDHLEFLGALSAQAKYEWHRAGLMVDMKHGELPSYVAGIESRRDELARELGRAAQERRGEDGLLSSDDDLSSGDAYYSPKYHHYQVQGLPKPPEPPRRGADYDLEDGQFTPRKLRENIWQRRVEAGKGWKEEVKAENEKRMAAMREAVLHQLFPEEFAAPSNYEAQPARTRTPRSLSARMAEAEAKERKALSRSPRRPVTSARPKR